MTSSNITASEYLPDSVNNRYELENPRFRGGFAYVCRAYDTRMERYVALKLLKENRVGEPQWLERFQREGRLMASVSHPNVVQVYDADTDVDTGLDYIAMEWVDGKSLDLWVIERPVRDAIERLDISVGICRGLEAIHSVGLVHGDITPRNILVTTISGETIAKLTDFGLSWNTADFESEFMAGTRGFLAPEQLKSGMQDQRSDIYALGAVLFYLFSGVHYLESISEAKNRETSALARAICEEPPRSLQMVLGTANARLDALLLRTLAKQPDERPQTVTDIRSQLEEIRNEYYRRTPEYLRTQSMSRVPTAVEDNAPPKFQIALYLTSGAARTARRLREQIEKLQGSSWRWDRDDELINEILNLGEDYDCYIYNDGPGRDLGEHGFSLIFAADTASEQNLSLFDKLHGTLVLECVHRAVNSSVLVRLISVRRDQRAGQRNTACLPATISFVSEDARRGQSSDIPPSMLHLVKQLPQGIQSDPKVAEQLQHWRDYLAVWEKLVQQRTFEVPYFSWHPHRNDNDEIVRIWFNLENVSRETWVQIERSRNDILHYREYELEQELASQWPELEESDPANPEYVEIGIVVKVERREGRLLVELDEKFLAKSTDENGVLAIPARAYLAYRAIGDLVQIKKQVRAFDDLEQGHTANPRLGKFLFNAEQALYPEKQQESLRPDEFLLQNLNPNQRTAVEGALGAPDMFLIWGPPGTGKTTVIAELCYQFARRGQRVLLSSQANLAVDNALSKLVHHPSIIALRIGRSDRVEEEGLEFTEEHVVTTWFRRTADEVEKRLDSLKENFDRFAALVEGDYLRLEHYYEILKEHQQKIELLAGAHKAVEDELDAAREGKSRICEGLRAVQNALQLLDDTGDHLQNGTRPTTEIFRAWRSDAVDLIAFAEYQQYLADISTTLHLVAEVSPSAIEELLDNTLPKGDRAILRKIQEGDKDAGLYRHSIFSILLLGLELGDVVKSIDEHIRPLGQELQALFAGYEDYRKLQHNLELCNQHEQSYNLSKALQSLHKPIRELTALSEGMSSDDKDLKSVERNLERVTREIDQLEDRIGELHGVLSNKDQVNFLINQIDSSTKKLVDGLAALQQAKVRHERRNSELAGIGREKVESERRLGNLKLLVERLAKAQEHVTGAAQRSTGGLCVKDLELLRGSFPDVLVEQLRKNRDAILITSQFDKNIEAYIDSYRIVEEKVQSYDCLPTRSSKHKEKVKVLKKKLLQLLEKQQPQNSCEYWVFKNPSQASKQLRAILSKDFRHDSYVELKCGVLWDFLPFMKKQVEILKECRPVSVPVIHRVVDTLLADQTSEMQRTEELILQKSQKEAEQRSQIKPVSLLVRELEKQALGDLETIPSNLQDLCHLVHVDFPSTLKAEFERANLPSDSGTLAANVRELMAQVDRSLETNAKNLVVLKNQKIGLVKRQTTLNDQLSQKRRELSERREDLSDKYAQISRIQEQLTEWREEPAVSEMLEALVQLGEQDSSDGLILPETFAAIYHRTLSFAEERTRGIAATIRQLTGIDRATSKKAAEQKARWETDANILQQQIEGMYENWVYRVRQYGYGPQITEPFLTGNCVAEWTRFEVQVSKIIGNSSAICIALDPISLLQKLKKLTTGLEVDIHKTSRDLEDQIRKLEAASRQTARDLSVYEERYRAEYNWWKEVFDTIPMKLRDALGPISDIHNLEFVTRALAQVQSEAWRDEVKRQQARLEPTVRMLEDWVARLQKQDARDEISLRELYVRSANVVGVTCGQVDRVNRYLRNARDTRPFDVVIVDEVSKATPPELLMPLLKGRKIVLVGDHKQLPPMIASKTLDDIAEERHIPRSDLQHIQSSLFENLYGFAPNILKAMLIEQYRMRRPIMHAINQFYGNMLVGGHDREHGMLLPNSIGRDTSIVWLSTPREPEYFENKEGTSFRNDSEVRIITEFLEQLNAAWLPYFEEYDKPKEVGLITFYMAQLSEFRSRFLGKNRFPALNLRIGTVDRFQGMERQVVIVSLVRNNADGIIGFAKEPRRINVAFSRAQELLVVVGCRALFTQQAKKAGEATEAYGRVAHVVEQEGRMIIV